MTFTDDLLNIPIAPDAHRFAAQFAAEQTSSDKGQRVYLNTLAVCAVHTYLNWLSVDATLHESDCWQPSLRALFNAADVLIPQLGRVECCPVLPTDDVLRVPHVRETPLGYTAVGLSADLTQAQLLGVVPQSALPPTAETVPLTQLQPVEALIDWLPNGAAAPVQLWRWLEQAFEADWRPAEPSLIPSFRSASPLQGAEPSANISRSKAIAFGDVASVVIVVMLLPTEAEYEIDFRVFPGERGGSLPLSLQLTLRDDSGASCAAVTVQDNDDWIQLEFTAQRSERFSVELVLGETTVVEYFQC
ncbi:MAG: DUF1822 family protein [Elainellaceae cyanobacterium]